MYRAMKKDQVKYGTDVLRNAAMLLNSHPKDILLFSSSTINNRNGTGKKRPLTSLDFAFQTSSPKYFMASDNHMGLEMVRLNKDRGSFWIATSLLSLDEALMTLDLPDMLPAGDSIPLEFRSQPVFMTFMQAIHFCNLLSERQGHSSYYRIDYRELDPDNELKNITSTNVIKELFFSGDWPVSLRFKAVINRNSRGYRLPTYEEMKHAMFKGNSLDDYKSSKHSNLGKLVEEPSGTGYQAFELGLLQAKHDSDKIGLFKNEQELIASRLNQRIPNEFGLYDLFLGRQWCDNLMTDSRGYEFAKTAGFNFEAFQKKPEYYTYDEDACFIDQPVKNRLLVRLVKNIP
jgi:hypothetical protein